MPNFDFSGWATRNDLKCADGRIIRRNAFIDNDGQVVPLVWNHQHNNPENVLGHALLENRAEGVYAYCSLNDTAAANAAREQISHGDINALSIYANHLKQNGPEVLHGQIREVSLVLAGANPGAFIDTLTFAHSDDGDNEAIIYTGEELYLQHSAPSGRSNMPNGKTVEEVFNELTDEQKEVVYYLVGMAAEEEGMQHSDMDDEEFDELLEEAIYEVLSEEDDNDEDYDDDYDEGDYDMKHNVFDTTEEMYSDELSHADMEAIFEDAKKFGSLKDSVLAHGITNIEYLYPDAKVVDGTPEFIKRPDEWVSVVMNGTHHVPFSRIKSLYADITEDEARARGYVKGNLKIEEVFSLLKRTTTPTTVYKKQKLDRDDIIDITDFDVVAWLKTEMRGMLDEEIARAILVGDGRPVLSQDKINESCIRPIWTDEALFTVNKVLTFTSSMTDDQKAKAVIRAAVKARKDYRGSGNPVLFTTEDWLTDMLLMEDSMGRVIYDTQDKLATALRVSKIVTVPVMENLTRSVEGETRKLIGIIVNLNDYYSGADKGGAVNMFDDFDIDYNAQKYLIETRCSGSLIKPYSAIILESSESSST